MADDTDSLRFLRDEVSRLQKELAETRAEAKNYRIKLKAEKTAHDETQAKLDDFLGQADTEFGDYDQRIAALEAERDEWKGKAETTPDEAAKRLRDLEGQIKLRDLKDAFAPLKDQLGEKVTLEQLWQLNGFDPAAVDPAEVKVDDLVTGWREATPSLFRGSTPETPPGGAKQSAKPPLRAGDAGSRGGRDTTPGKVRYRSSDLARPGWEVSNPALLEAIQSGNAEVIE